MYTDKAMKKKKKIIEITILIIAVLWILLFVVDYFRYKNSAQPLIVLNYKETEFSDGTVDEYYSIGWVYREYKRRAIGDIELTPFWKKMKRPVAKGDLPETEKNYDIPVNKERLDEFKGIVYYYNTHGSLIGTYKCLNTKNECQKAISGKDEDHIKDLDPLTKLETEPKFNMYEQRYAFIDDSLEQAENANEKQYKRTIYLFDILNNKILAQYRNVKYSTITEDNKADGYLGRFIVQNDDNKWGVIEPTINGPKTIINFEYDSINYNENTKSYIVKKDNKWYLFNDETNEISNGFDDIILEAFQASGNTYIKTVKIHEIGTNKISNYYLSSMSGLSLIKENNVISIQITDNYISYVTNDATLKIIDFDGKSLLKENIKLYFTNFTNDKDNIPAYKITRFYNGEVQITIPKSNVKDTKCDIYTYKNWELKEKEEGNWS